jgi:hypothetical protein
MSKNAKFASSIFLTNHAEKIWNGVGRVIAIFIIDGLASFTGIFSVYSTKISL